MDEKEFERDERLPYWAELWPSADALSRYLARVDLTGRRAIELGCGVGLPAVVALAGGAEVLATDHYEAALDFAAYNARLNTGRDLATALLDWHTPKKRPPGRFDLVVAADVLYEARNAPALADLVPRLLARGGEALIADPRRNAAPRFLARMEGRGFEYTTVETTVEGSAGPVRVMIHRLRYRG